MTFHESKRTGGGGAEVGNAVTDAHDMGDRNAVSDSSVKLGLDSKPWYLLLCTVAVLCVKSQL